MLSIRFELQDCKTTCADWYCGDSAATPRGGRRAAWYASSRVALVNSDWGRLVHQIES
jgi:hypothetical protein